MRNYMVGFFVASACFLTVPASSPASDKIPSDNAAIVEPDRGNFEGDVSEAADEMRESLQMMRRDKFYRKLNKLLENGDTKKAEKLLGEHVQKLPEQKNDEAYTIAKSKIAYAKGDYLSAYAEADKLITEIEKTFAPQKPYEMDFKNKNVRGTVFDIYILRFQALARLQRHEEALADLNRAQNLNESPELLRAKTSTLLWLGKYAEAAAAADKAYAMDKNIFASSQYGEHYCQHFGAQGYSVKACADFVVVVKGKTEKKKAVQ